MSTTTTQIKQLREATFASFLDCAKALEAHHGDFDQALEQLRSTNLSKADQKANRETHEGLVIVKRAGNSVCAVQVSCETDFVALTQELKMFTHRLADQILHDPALNDVDSVLAADFIDAPGQTIAMTAKELAGKLGENIEIGHIARYESRHTSVIEGYIHAGAIEGYGPNEGRLGVLVELAVEDANAAVEATALQDLAHNLALQIASGHPTYLSPDDIPADVLDKQRMSPAAQLATENKSDATKTQILEDLLNKFYQEACLLNQAYIRDDNISVRDLLQQKGEEIGTPLHVVRFARLGLNA